MAIFINKIIIAKIETTVEGTITQSRISNTRSNKLDALWHEFMNSVKFTTLDTDFSLAKEEFDELSKRLSDTKDLILDNKANNIFRKNAIAELYRQLHRYFPTITDFSVENYINHHTNNEGQVNVSANLIISS